MRKGSYVIKDIKSWFETGEDDLGYHIMTEAEIVDSVTEVAETSKEEDEGNFKLNIKVIKVKIIIQYLSELYPAVCLTMNEYLPNMICLQYMKLVW